MFESVAKSVLKMATSVLSLKKSTSYLFENCLLIDGTLVYLSHTYVNSARAINIRCQLWLSS